MATTNLEFLILAKDQASEAFEKVSGAVEKQRGALEKLRAAGTIAAAALVAGVAKFSSDSVEAYSEAEKKQALLADAFKKFPALGDTNIAKLNELNDAIQRKTGYDNDDLAASQAKLAVYGLTGAQIAQLTPLVADYAAKTGTDLVTASEAVGKSMLGQGRALKNVGINFHDTKTVAGNFNEVLDGLKSKVGGTADAMGNTASGKVEILKKSYEDLQEKIGSMLVPVLEKLVGVGQTVLDWMAKNPAVVQTLAIVLGVLTIAIIAVTAAMWAMSLTPVGIIVGLIVIAIAALIAVVVLLATHWKEVTAFITTVWQGFITWITNGIKGLVSWWNKSWNDFALGVQQAWNSGIVAPIRDAWNWIQNAIRVGGAAIKSVWDGIWSGLGGIVKGAFNGVLGFIEGGVNGAIDLIDGMISSVNAVGGAFGVHISPISHIHIPRYASGTDFASGGLSLVGERGPELMNVPRGAQITPNGGVATVRIHRDDLQTWATLTASAIMAGSQKTVRDALGV